MKTQDDHNLDALIGLFSSIAIVLLVMGALWLRDYSPLQKSQYIKVSFNNVAGLTQNAAVYMNGIRVGMVDKIQPRGTTDVVVTLRINADKAVLPIGSRFDILTMGFVWAKYIDVTCPDEPSRDAHPQAIPPTEIVIGNDPMRPEIVVSNLNSDRRRIARALDELSAVSHKLVPLLGKADRMASNPKIGADVKQTMNDTKVAVGNLSLVAKQMNQILDKKHPLMHMMWGRPGHLKDEDKDSKERLQ